MKFGSSIFGPYWTPALSHLCVLLFATLLSPSFSLFCVFLVIPLSLYLSPQSSSPSSYCPYPFNPITVFLSNSLSNLKHCFITIVRFLCIRTWNRVMNSFFFLLEIFFNKCRYYILNFSLFIFLTALSQSCFAWAFASCSGWGLPSRCSGFSRPAARALGRPAFSSCGWQALECTLSSWDTLA